MAVRGSRTSVCSAWITLHSHLLTLLGLDPSGTNLKFHFLLSSPQHKASIFPVSVQRFHCLCLCINSFIPAANIYGMPGMTQGLFWALRLCRGDFLVQDMNIKYVIYKKLHGSVCDYST